MVLILGCGYVGKEAGLLLKQDPSLVVTTRSPARIVELEKIFPKVLLLDTSQKENLTVALQGHKSVILTLAPKSIDDYTSCYLQTMINLKEALKTNSDVTHLIYTSSSSVYGDCPGQLVDERTPLNPITSQGQTLVEAEKVLSSIASKKICIFRVCEIYGLSREISGRVRMLQGKKAAGDGSQIANMIHVTDVARAVYFAIDMGLDGVFNLCDDDAMPRKTLYDLICDDLSLPKLEWDPHLKSMHGGRRLLSNSKLKSMGFELAFPKRLKFLKKSE